QLLTAAVMNLLHNAFEHTPSGARVIPRARAEDQRLLIATEAQCGGIPDSYADLFQVFCNRRCSDRSGPGPGLAIPRKAVRAHSGVIGVRNVPGKGCVFTIEVPLAAEGPVRQTV